jgi:hypothetical protein
MFWLLWSEPSPSIGVQIMALWHNTYSGRQVCPKVLVGLNYLQVYMASHIEHVYIQDVQKLKFKTQ